MLKPSCGVPTYGNVGRYRAGVGAGGLNGCSVTQCHRAVGRIGRRDQRVRGTRDRLQLDLDDVVGEPAAVREPGQVAAEDAQLVRARRRRDGHVQAQQVGVPVLQVRAQVLEARDDPRRQSGHQDRHQVCPARAGGVQRREVREHAGVEDRQQVRELGMLDVGQEVPVVLRDRSRFHSSLRLIGTMTSLNSGLPRRETWTQGPEPLLSCPCGPSLDPHLAAARAGVDAEHGLRAERVRRDRSVAGQLRDRHLDHDRVHVERGERVGTVRRRHRDQVEAAGSAAARRGRRSSRDRRRTDRSAGRRRPSRRSAASGSPRSRGSCSSASSAGRCCRAGTADSSPSTLSCATVRCA